MMFPKKAVFEGNNKMLILYKDRGMKQQKFDYDEVNQVWQNINSERVFGVDSGSLKTAKFDNLPEQKWKIKYCDEVN